MGYIEGEEVLIKTKPHVFAFMGSYILWTYIFIVTSLFMLKWEFISSIIIERVSWIKLFPWISNMFNPVIIAYILWSLLIMVPLIAISIRRIMWRYVGIGILIVLAPIVTSYILGIGIEKLYIEPLIMSFIALIAVEIHRRSHNYIVTNRRIILEYKSPFKHERRDVLYSRLQDIVLEKSALGKLFNFGDIIPITASGIGTGEDSAAVSVGGGIVRGIGVGVAISGIRGVKVPRSRSYYILYGVPNPERVYDKIIEGIKSSEEAPYLRKILEELKDMKSKISEGGKWDIEKSKK